MIGPDQITVPARFGTLIRDFGPEIIGPKFFEPVHLKDRLMENGLNERFIGKRTPILSERPF